MSKKRGERVAQRARGRCKAIWRQTGDWTESSVSTRGKLEENANAQMTFPAHKRAHIIVRSTIKVCGALSSDSNIETNVKCDRTDQKGVK